MRRIAIGMAMLAATGGLLARQQTQTPPGTAAVFRAGVEYVSVDVVVTDKNDKPVTDLTKADFIIDRKSVV